MNNLKKIFKDHNDAGSVNSLLAVNGFIDDYTFIAKTGDIGMMFRVTGVDYEGCDHERRQSIVHAFEAAMRLLDDRYRVYQYSIKRRVTPFAHAACDHLVAADAINRRIDEVLNARVHDLYVQSQYLVIMTEGLQSHQHSTKLQRLFKDPKRALREWLSGPTSIRVIEAEVMQSVSKLHNRADSFRVQLNDTIKPVRMTKTEIYQFLGDLVNYSTHQRTPLVYDTHVDYFVANTGVECERDHLLVGTHTVKVLTMKDPPSQTFAHILHDMHTVSGEFITCMEWRRIPTDKMRSDINSRRRHFFNKRTSMINYLSTSENQQPQEMLVDSSADATVAQLGHALQQMDNEGHAFGECSFTVVFHDRDPQVVEQGMAEAIKVFAARDGQLVPETYNLLNAWLSVMPGNHARNLRRLALLDTNYADLSGILFTLDTGSPVSRYLNRESLAVFETKTSTPFNYELHVGDVGHTAIFGTPGSGKSFLLNFLIMQAQRYNPFTVIFDVGHSYKKMTQLMGGGYLELGVDEQMVKLNPFTLDPTPENLHFLHHFVRVLLEGRSKKELSAIEDQELYDAVCNLYMCEKEQRTLFTLSSTLPAQMQDRLLKWTNPIHGLNDGRYGFMFDNVEDTLSLQHLQVFEFSKMEEYPELLEPLLFYVLHRVTEQIKNNPELAVCVMDEAWKFIQHKLLRKYVQEALKTWRKHNASLFIATQAVTDFSESELFNTVIEDCPTKIFLANPYLNRDHYKKWFHLNEMEVDLVTDLTPRQMVMKRPGLTRVLVLNVDRATYWLYTNTPADNERLKKAIEVYGFPAALDQLAKNAA